MKVPERARTAILGSCVSRDLLRISMEAEAVSILYIARQSMISFGASAIENAPEEPEFPHEFQLASHRSDIRGSGLDEVSEIASTLDLLLIDIVDERHGFYISDRSEVITRSIDGIGTGIYEELAGWEHVEFGTARHLQAFKDKAAHAKQQLLDVGLFEKTVVILAPWASKLSNGERTPLSMGRSADWANSVLPDYEKIFEDLGFTIVRPTPETIVGDPHHQWGPAAFHYIKSFYDSLAEQIRPHIAKAPTTQ